jgi:3'-phosphoadenosine 5'-phosphosulfate sulfotransferase (PAPS reductase)/FAD synthetase
MLEARKNAILQFSGGKDSTALLYMARPWLDQITVVFADTGAVFPHLLAHVEDTCKRLGAKLVTLKSDVVKHTEQHGLPADIVPVDTTAMMAIALNPKPLQILQPYTACCGAMIWVPMLHYIRENSIDLVLRGSKRDDPRVGVGPSVEVEGVLYKSPLWEWSDGAVFDYCKVQGAPLPEHYDDVNDSLDCWLCTAHLAYHGDEKLRYIREHYPDLWPIVTDRLRRVERAVVAQLDRIAPALDVMEEA